MTTLQNIYQESVEFFLKTVVCFDDAAYTGNNKESTSPSKASKPKDGFEDDEIIEDAPTQDSTTSPSDFVNDDSHELDARAMTHAFAKKGILCSVINPGDEPQEIANSIACIARTADVVILDWEMPRHDTSVTRSAVIDILKKDKEDGGCLRMIVIYSAAKGDDVIDSLEVLLKNNGHLFTKSSNGFELIKDQTLIVFLNKPNVSHAPSNIVRYQDLPDRISREMLKLADGLLPSTAIRAVASIRNNTHHLLAKFPKMLDGAYIIHRALIPDPNDAEPYVLGLLAMEMVAPLTNERIGQAINAHGTTQWVEENNNILDKVKGQITEAITTVKSQPDKELKVIFDIKKEPKEIASWLFENLYDQDGAKQAQQEFSILSGVDRDSSRLNGSEALLPRLKLGTIVKLENCYLLCIQPLCDSVRLSYTATTWFPFLRLCVRPSTAENCQHSKIKSLDICLKDRNGIVVWLGVEALPKHLISYGFRAISEEMKYVAAECRNGTYIFSSSDDGPEFEWCADLRISKAQRLVSDLASRIHTLGIDEFEWMRLHQRR